MPGIARSNRKENRIGYVKTGTGLSDYRISGESLLLGTYLEYVLMRLYTFSVIVFKESLVMGFI